MRLRMARRKSWSDPDSTVLSVYRLKPRFQALLRPIAHRLSRHGASANQVTVAACLVSVLLGIWLTAHGDRLQWFLLLPLWCFLRMALNAIDGIMARECDQRSTLGAYLNELGDVIADAALLVPFAVLAGSSVALVGLALFLGFLAELAGILGVLVGGNRRHDGPMGKSDRAFVLGVLGLLVGLGVPTASWISFALSAVAILLVVTTFNRVRSGIRSARSAPAGASQK